ncbi:MAG: methyltransferase domain-containing protein [Desulfitobacterium sp.]
MNEGLPFEDNSAEIILACHSLEHMDDLYFTMSEIFRICKHKAILYILAPYYKSSLNIANLYHKNVFNEETFRFFSKYP